MEAAMVVLTLVVVVDGEEVVSVLYADRTHEM